MVDLEPGDSSNSVELYIRACETAADTWASVTSQPNYELVVGKALFREIFAIAPQAVAMYSFGESVELENCSVPDELFELPTFETHAKGVVRMLESVVVMMMGNDVSDLGDILVSLGARHIEYGVHPAHYSVLETALLRTLASLLEDKWTTEARKGWAAVIKFVARGMQAGAGAQVEVIRVARRELERDKSATLRLRVMTNSVRTSKLSRDKSAARFKEKDNRKKSSGPPRLPARRVERRQVESDKGQSDSKPLLPGRNEKRDSLPMVPSRGVKCYCDDSSTEGTVLSEDEEREVRLCLSRVRRFPYKKEAISTSFAPKSRRRVFLDAI